MVSFEVGVVVFSCFSVVVESAQYIIEEANAAGKPLILAVEAANGSFATGSVEPNTLTAENSAALLMLTYNAQPDHGSTMGNFFTHTLPSVLAEMLFGDREPSGKLMYEIARNSEDALSAWGELAYDTGVDPTTRLYMAATVRQNPTAELANNMGDVLYPAEFGMKYGEAADIKLNTLIMDTELATVERESMRGVQEVTLAVNKTQKSGEAFDIYMIAENAGADGTIFAEAYDGDQVVGSQVVSVEGGDFAIVTMKVTLDGAGEHTITVGENSLTVNVE